MKANELMVGDFIYQHHPKDNTPHIVKVSVDTLHLMDRMEIGFIQEQSPLYRIIEPIPLTPEILEKNGWVKTDIFMEFKSEYPEIKLDWTSRLGSSLYRNDHYLCDCDYVHELQHALKLCGIEKTIEL